MACEVSWFAALCDDDYEFLGVQDPRLLSSWEHCRDIALTAESAGYDNLLLPSGYAMGIDSVSFAAAIAPMLRRMRLLVAVPAVLLRRPVRGRAGRRRAGGGRLPDVAGHHVRRRGGHR